jgi:hypothetical protein
MSKQVNFFADPVDTTAFHSWLLKSYPYLRVIREDRGTPKELQPVPADEALNGPETMYLVVEWVYDNFCFSPLILDDRGTFDSERVVLDATVSPVVEYVPCRFDAVTNSVTGGRLYWYFCGELRSEQQAQIDRMLNWVRRHTIPGGWRMRVFEHAARNQRRLDLGYGTKVPSPPWPG